MGCCRSLLFLLLQMKAMLRQMPGGSARLQAAASMYCMPSASDTPNRPAELAEPRAGALNQREMSNQLALYLQLTLSQLGLPVGS